MGKSLGVDGTQLLCADAGVTISSPSLALSSEPLSGDYTLRQPALQQDDASSSDWEPIYRLAENKSAKNVYIPSATLNGKPLRIPVTRHDEIVAGTSPKLVLPTGGPASRPAVAAQISRRLAICGLRSPKDIGWVDA
jgi:hypothetical protein